MSMLHHDRVYIWLAEQFVAFGLPLALLFSGLGARICKACERIARGHWFLTAFLFAGVYVLLSVVFSLPIDFIAFLRLSAWGLPAESVGQWAAQEAGDTLRLTLIAAALGWAPFWIVALSPKRWCVGGPFLARQNRESWQTHRSDRSPRFNTTYTIDG